MHFIEINEVLKRLTASRRWKTLMSEASYNELSKQALNCLTTFLLATSIESSGRRVINWKRFPKIALFVAFQKAWATRSCSEIAINAICNSNGIDSEVIFIRHTVDEIVMKTSKEFAEFLLEGVGTYEFHIYKVATRVATYIELRGIHMEQNDEFLLLMQQVIKSLDSYDDIPEVDIFTDTETGIYKLIKKMSDLRFLGRMSTALRTMECSVLGHLFDTGCFAYLMSLDLEPDNERLATDLFFRGLFHDVVERWTEDMPSPLKDGIPGLRQAVESFEKMKLDEVIYGELSGLPSALKGALREIMDERQVDMSTRRLLKGADYLSADREGWLNIMTGSHDVEFLEAISRNRQKLAEGHIRMSPSGKELHDFYYATIMGRVR